MADLAQHAEDGADAHVDVDVAGTIERVEQQQVFALRVAVGHDVDRVHLFAGHRGQVAAPLVGLDQHLVADDVELFLRLTLHVVGAGVAEDVAQGPFVHRDGDALASTRHDLDQQTKLRWNAAVFALLLDQELGEADSFHRQAVFRRIARARG
jgi:hypothetical protein